MNETAFTGMLANSEGFVFNLFLLYIREYLGAFLSLYLALGEVGKKKQVEVERLCVSL